MRLSNGFGNFATQQRKKQPTARPIRIKLNPALNKVESNPSLVSALSAKDLEIHDKVMAKVEPVIETLHVYRYKKDRRENLTTASSVDRR